MEKKKEKIAAVVVSYNRKILLVQCLDALLLQVFPIDLIIVVDNASTDGTSELLKERGYIGNKKIKYIGLKENTGGAGGFYEGMKMGFEMGFDWLWLMDDDAIPEKRASLALVEGSELLIKNNTDFGALGSIAIENREFCKLSWVFKSSNPKKDYHSLYELDRNIEVESLSFLGIFINREMISEIGYPEKDLFIWWDEIEYSLRIKAKNKKMFVVISSILIHPKGVSDKEVKLPFNKVLYIKSSSLPPWKDYYDIRNGILIIKRHRLKISKCLKILLTVTLSFIFSATLRDQKFKRVKNSYLGLVDGIKGRAGKKSGLSK